MVDACRGFIRETGTTDGMDCACTVTTTGGVALVEVRLRNRTPVARRARVENRLDGPVLPPRTEGVPEAGWDRAGVSVVVPPHETQPLGYACPLDTGPDGTADSPPTDPPAAVVADERAPEPTGAPRRADAGARLPARDDTDRSVEAVVRGLGRPAPPRDAVPAPAAGSSGDADAEADTDSPAITGEVDADTDSPAILDDADADSDGLAIPDDADPGAAAEHPDHDTSSDDLAPEDTLPPPVAAWLAGVERRVEATERLDPDVPVAAATDAVQQIECRPTALPGRLAVDHRQLVAVAARVEDLAARAEAASVPADDLRRLS